MNIERKIKKTINDVKPSEKVFMNICKEVGIEKKCVPQKSRSSILRIYLPIFACLVLMVTCVSIVFALPKGNDKSYFLVEMNSKVELVSKDNIVVEQYALDNQAQVLLLGKDYKQMTVANAIRQLANDAENLGIIAKGDIITISAVIQTNVNINGAKKIENNETIVGTVGNDFNLNCSFSNKNELVSKVSNKLGIDKGAVNNKKINELIRLYTGFDENTLISLNKHIEKSISDYQAEYELNLKSDDELKNCYDFIDLATALRDNSKQYILHESERLKTVIDKYVDCINERFDNIIQNFSVSNENIISLENLIKQCQNTAKIIVENYKNQFDYNVYQLKLNILTALND